MLGPTLSFNLNFIFKSKIFNKRIEYPNNLILFWKIFILNIFNKQKEIDFPPGFLVLQKPWLVLYTELESNKQTNLYKLPGHYQTRCSTTLMFVKFRQKSRPVILRAQIIMHNCKLHDHL